MLRSVVLAFVISLLQAIVAASLDDFEKSTTIWAWPVSAAEPSELAHVAFNPDTLEARVTKLISPDKLIASSDLVRVGLYDSKTGVWRGSVTSSKSFAEHASQHLRIHVDQSGDPYHTTFTAFTAPKPRKKAKTDKARAREKKKLEKQGKDRQSARQDSGQEGQATTGNTFQVEISKSMPGPSTHLNKPVILNADGKVPEVEPEKTFLQKYWWAIGLFLLMQVAMGFSPSQDAK